MALLTLHRLRLRRFLSVGLVFFFLLFAADSSIAQNADDGSREYKIKAVFLYHFSHFVEWPDGLQTPSGRKEVSLCVLGENPFGDSLSFIQRQYRDVVDLKLHYLTSDFSRERLKSCDIAYFSRSLAADFPWVLSLVNGLPVLTVSDLPDFIQEGGMIEFVSRDNKVRLRMHLQRFVDAGFKSSKLIELSEVVR